jgi:hypothetical protein
MNKLHYVHSRAGRIGGRADTAPEDIDKIVASLRKDDRKHLILHFHGGLVSKEAGLATAEKLFRIYSPANGRGGYPIFFVWESGPWETIRNNIIELADEPVFKQLLRKVLQYALENLGANDPSDLTRSLTKANIGSRHDEARDALEKFWARPAQDTIPFRGYRVSSDVMQSRAASQIPSEDEVIADLEQDAALLRAIGTLADSSSRGSLSNGGSRKRTDFAELAADSFQITEDSRGAIELYAVGKFLLKVLVAVLARHSSGRDHGLYATCVEELIRGFKVAGSSSNEWVKALEWNRMKKDTADAFNPNPDIYAGTALLTRLKKMLLEGGSIDRITLVGHSTGAIYVANWLENSVGYLPDSIKQDVIFLAPAITYDRFAVFLRQCRGRIGHFRMFALGDDVERDDQVWGQDDVLPGGKDWRRFIYPSSLLYLVSGILESTESPPAGFVDEPDMPLLGMERFWRDAQVYPNANFASICEVRDWIRSRQNSLVWSKSIDQPGAMNCGCVDHGGFYDDPSIREGLQHIVELGF